MHTNPLIKILKTFSKEEMIEFEKFLETPFFKPDRNLTPFFRYIKEYYPEFTAEELKKTIAFSRLFPGKKYDQQKLTNLMYFLARAAEKFRAYNSLLKDKIDYQLNLSQIHYLNKLPELAETVNVSTESHLANNFGFSVRKNFLSRYRKLVHIKNSMYADSNEFVPLLDNSLKYFNLSAISFVMDYLEILGNKEPAKNTYGIDIENKFVKAVKKCFKIDEFLTLIKQDDPRDKEVVKAKKNVNRKKHSVKKEGLKKEEDPKPKAETNNEKLSREASEKLKEAQKIYIEISHHLFRILEKPDNEVYYHEFKKFYYGYIGNKEACILDREEVNTIFNHLLNYCANKHNLKYMRESLEVQKKMLELDYFSELESNYMQLHLYRNIVQVCSTLIYKDMVDINDEKKKLAKKEDEKKENAKPELAKKEEDAKKEMDWFENFINVYTEKLNPEIKDDLYRISMAHLSFLKGDYEESLKWLSKVEDPFELSKTDLRSLELKNFYELKHSENESKYSDEIDKKIHNYQKFLSVTTEIADINVEFFRNFLKYYFKLFALDPDADENDLHVLRLSIENEKTIVNKLWLIQKVKDLMDGEE